MTFLSPTDKSVTSCSWRGIQFTVSNGRIFIDDQFEDASECISELASHGFAVSADQSEIAQTGISVQTDVAKADKPSWQTPKSQK